MVLTSPAGTAPKRHSAQEATGGSYFPARRRLLLVDPQHDFPQNLLGRKMTPPPSSGASAEPDSSPGPPSVPPTTSTPPPAPAWDALYQQHGEAVLRTAQRVLGGDRAAVGGSSAEDVRQEVFTSAIEHGIPYIGGAGQVRTYLNTGARWQLTRLRRLATREEPVGAVDEDARDASAGPLLDPCAAVDDRLDDEQAVQLNRQHFACLNANQRFVMEERVEKGRPRWAVAEDLQRTPPRVTQLEVEALRTLDQCVRGVNPNCKASPAPPGTQQARGGKDS
jgi:RNA polymerase sigma factor (sigma-70 family)